MMHGQTKIKAKCWFELVCRLESEPRCVLPADLVQCHCCWY